MSSPRKDRNSAMRPVTSNKSVSHARHTRNNKPVQPNQPTDRLGPTKLGPLPVVTSSHCLWCLPAFMNCQPTIQPTPAQSVWVWIYGFILFVPGQATTTTTAIIKSFPLFLLLLLSASSFSLGFSGHGCNAMEYGRLGEGEWKG